MERARLSVLAVMRPVGGVGGELHACVSIDLQTSGGAPRDELLRIEVDPVGCVPGPSDLALSLLHLTLPLVERRGETLRIDHDLADAGIIRALVPDEADSGDGRRFS